MIISQVFLLPVVVLAMMYLINRKDLMKGHKVSLTMNIGFVIIIIFTLVISYQVVVGLISRLVQLNSF
jgi:Mn2+/Fe2+ NRAMP family transporter